MVIDVWIDKFVDLSHKLIVDGIGDIPEDILDYLDEDNYIKFFEFVNFMILLIMMYLIDFMHIINWFF